MSGMGGGPGVWVVGVEQTGGRALIGSRAGRNGTMHEPFRARGMGP